MLLGLIELLFTREDRSEFFYFSKYFLLLPFSHFIKNMCVFNSRIYANYSDNNNKHHSKVYIIIINYQYFLDFFSHTFLKINIHRHDHLFANYLRKKILSCKSLYKIFLHYHHHCALKCDVIFMSPKQTYSLNSQ